MTSCAHSSITLTTSQHATVVGYKQLPTWTLIAAAEASGSASDEDHAPPPSTFPAPLILPFDELAFNPRSHPQSFRSWRSSPHRNAISTTRNKIYLLPPPRIAYEARFAEGWEKPHIQCHGVTVVRPSTADVAQYCEAFFPGVSSQVLQNPHLELAVWEEKNDSKPQPGKIRQQPRKGSSYLSLQISASTAIRIRTRKTPYSLYSHQLNLNDLLDAALEILPPDAYAFVMLVEQDLYEDEEDDFCCGRAYGGSRVCIVSTARYNPILDEKQGIDREHSWPMSHCATYINRHCREYGTMTKQKASSTVRKTSRSAGAIGAAITAASNKEARDDTYLSVLWLARVCKTVSHELLHCWGLDHCVYHACVMQSTANVVEDARQPPYLVRSHSYSLMWLE